ncbi:light-mediated development protein DET1 [Nocardia rhamnosiphila]
MPIYQDDELVVMVPISHLGLHTTPAGGDGFLISQRVVPVRRDNGVVYARPLVHDEPDDGRRVHIRPGEKVAIEPRVELDYIDRWEGDGVTGYVPLTPVLFTWMAIAAPASVSVSRYLLAAARRLDQAQALFQRVEDLRQTEPEGAPAARRAIFALVGAVELALVSLARVVDMCEQAHNTIGVSAPVPQDIVSRATAVREVRNAYEHIEDRALGNVRRKPDPDAATIFDHETIVRDGVIAYGRYRLDLASDIPILIVAARKFLKDISS